MGNSILYAMNCNHRMVATLYTLETWFFFRYIIVNTLHKGGNE